eukprot:2342677-Pleurochrysis_carterae.AAC.1
MHCAQLLNDYLESVAELSEELSGDELPTKFVSSAHAELESEACISVVELLRDTFEIETRLSAAMTALRQPQVITQPQAAAPAPAEGGQPAEQSGARRLYVSGSRLRCG